MSSSTALKQKYVSSCGLYCSAKMLQIWRDVTETEVYLAALAPENTIPSALRSLLSTVANVKGAPSRQMDGGTDRDNKAPLQYHVEWLRPRGISSGARTLSYTPFHVGPKNGPAQKVVFSRAMIKVARGALCGRGKQLCRRHKSH